MLLAHSLILVPVQVNDSWASAVVRVLAVRCFVPHKQILLHELFDTILIDDWHPRLAAVEDLV